MGNIIEVGLLVNVSAEKGEITMAISFVDVLAFIKELISDSDKLAKFKEVIEDIKELINDIKDCVAFFKN